MARCPALLVTSPMSLGIITVTSSDVVPKARAWKAPDSAVACGCLSEVEKTGGTCRPPPNDRSLELTLSSVSSETRQNHRLKI